jgi:hypothetical protein
VWAANRGNRGTIDIRQRKKYKFHDWGFLHTLETIWDPLK